MDTLKFRGMPLKDVIAALESQGLPNTAENLARVVAQMGADMEGTAPDTAPRALPDATPGHYQYPIQPKDYAQANGLTFAQGNVVKYVTRYKAKGGVRDLLKAIDYLLDLAEYEQLGEATVLPRVERLKNVLDRDII
jgi:hypothetical protein